MTLVLPHPAIDGFDGIGRPLQRLDEVVAMVQQHASYGHGSVVADRDLEDGPKQGIVLMRACSDPAGVDQLSHHGVRRLSALNEAQIVKNVMLGGHVLDVQERSHSLVEDEVPCVNDRLPEYLVKFYSRKFRRTSVYRPAASWCPARNTGGTNPG